MKTIRMTILGLAAAMIPAWPVLAADLGSSGFDYADLRPSVEESSSSSWTGVYAGGNVGGMWNNGNTKSYSGLYNGLPSDALLVGKHGNDAVFMGGVQFGFNYQADELVYGLEGDVSFADRGSWKNTTASYPGLPDWQASMRSRASLDWFGTLRGRLGYVVSDAFMIYGTAGLAVGRTHVKAEGSTQYLPTAHTGLGWSASKSHTNMGWVAGIGGEYAFDRNWSMKGEYLHVDLGSKSYALANGDTLRQKTTADILRVGFNYRFQ